MATNQQFATIKAWETSVPRGGLYYITISTWKILANLLVTT